jgi:hypothetical protein
MSQLDPQHRGMKCSPKGRASAVLPEVLLLEDLALNISCFALKYDTAVASSTYLYENVPYVTIVPNIPASLQAQIYMGSQPGNIEDAVG